METKEPQTAMQELSSSPVMRKHRMSKTSAHFRLTRALMCFFHLASKEIDGNSDLLIDLSSGSDSSACAFLRSPVILGHWTSVNQGMVMIKEVIR